MKKLLWVALLLGLSAYGEEADDRAEIGRVIALLNAPTLPAGVFTADSDGASALAGLWLPAVNISHEPWGEATWSFAKPRITSGEVRFLTPNVALVEGVAHPTSAKPPPCW